MAGSARSAPTGCVQFADPDAPGGAETTPREFLAACRRHAKLRAGRPMRAAPAHRIFERASPATLQTSPRCVVRLQVATSLLAAWQANAPPQGGRTRTQFVDQQVGLVLDDLCLGSPTAFLPLRPRDAEACALDAEQAVHQTLLRTQLAPCQPLPKVVWEGTLVTSVAPTAAVVVLTVGT